MLVIRPDLKSEDIKWLNDQMSLAGRGVEYARRQPVPQTCRIPGNQRECSKIRSGECVYCLPRSREEAARYDVEWDDL